MYKLHLRTTTLGTLLCVGLASGAYAVKQQLDNANQIPAVTFADKQDNIFVPARIIAQKLNVDLQKKDSKTLLFGDKEIAMPRALQTGASLVPLQAIRDLGGEVDKVTSPGQIKVKLGSDTFDINVGTKKIDVDQAQQRLVGTQGSLVVIDTNVSTGSRGHRTPNGTFKTGPYKSRYHYSRLYNNAPMPYSIQVNGNIFFHGFGSVPSYPASHGCIRVPLGRKNPAKYLFNWAETGIETSIHGRYVSKSYKKKSSKRRSRRR
jgi:lipoprotein-anchoring transpeptidase ErfK/SrfK